MNNNLKVTRKTFSIIFGMFLLVVALVSEVSAKNFIIQNQSNPGQNYFVVNGTNSLEKLSIKWGDVKI